MKRAQYYTANVWGMNVRYVQAGDGPGVLLIHGLAASRLTWSCNIDTLAASACRGIAVVVPVCRDRDERRETTPPDKTGQEAARGTNPELTLSIART